MSKYCLGIDYGTQSGRVVLVEVGSAKEIATAIKEYAHGVMDEYLPDRKIKLPADWALEHPRDYIEVLEQCIPQVIKKTGIDPADIIGIGVDFTSCTMLPIDEEGQPLCYKKEYESDPHSYVKLWKHHAAQDEADKINDIAGRWGEAFLQRYGGKISSEWLFAKIWQVLDEAPHIYAATDRFIEAGDWVVLQLTGSERRNSCAAGYKAMWHKKDGYPSKEFFAALDPRLENVVEAKLSPDVYSVGTKAGELTEAMAKRLGLTPGTAVSVAGIDAHVAVPAVGVAEKGQLVIIIGTSSCHMLLGDKDINVPGICGVVEDGILPGYFGFEAGQACCGDHFEWFIKNCVPASYVNEAKERGIDVHQLLTEKAAALKPGQSGLIALDWWNGNRCVLVDANLSGLLLGCTLQTKPEEIYRALIEATAFGARMIIETFKSHNVEINGITASGGITEKNPLLMQIYADVTGLEIKVGASKQAVALGAAMFGAVAAGKQKGGYDTIAEAVKEMGRVQEKVYKPILENSKSYDIMYKYYVSLHDYFGRGSNNIMKVLKKLKF